MKKILFDIISLQEFHNGGEEYVRIVLEYLQKNDKIEIIGLYDSKLKFLDNDFHNLSSAYKLIDIQKKSIGDIIKEESIDTFFIGIGQRYRNYNLSNINCRTICIIHDIGDIEYSENKIHYHFPKSLKRFINLISDYWLSNWVYSFSSRVRNSYINLVKFLTNSNVELITVSNYTLNSIKYNFPELKHKTINVFYPPVKSYERKDCIDNPVIQRFLNENKPYLLLLNVNRENKNGEMILEAFNRIKLDFPYLKLAVTGASQEIITEDILYLKYISNSDMENLYKRAWVLVYPSYTEGFGYPPVEAMKYGTPVLAANVCSMPEILDNAAVYFSPFYKEGFYQAFNNLIEKYDSYTTKCSQHADSITLKQTEDLEKLINIIIQ